MMSVAVLALSLTARADRLFSSEFLRLAQADEAAQPGDGANGAAQPGNGAQPAPGDNGAQPANGEAQPNGAPELRVVVTAFKGRVQVRQGEDQPWQAPRAGMVLSVSGSVRTGPRGALQLKIDPGHTIAIDRMSFVTVINALRADETIRTDFGMKYGRLRYDVEEVGELHDARVHTPGTTMAIRGTEGGTQSDAFGTTTWSKTGNVQRQQRGDGTQVVTVNGGQVDDDHPTPGTFAFDQTGNNPLGGFAGLTNEELALVDMYPGGEFNLGQIGVSGLQQLADADQFTKSPEFDFGDLEVVQFLTAWSPMGEDVDLIVFDPLGGVLDPKGQVIVRAGLPTQGVHSGDYMGQMTMNFEQVVYAPQAPGGEYQVDVVYLGSGSVDVTLQSFFNATVVNTEVFTLDQGVRSRSFCVDPKMHHAVAGMCAGVGGQGINR